MKKLILALAAIAVIGTIVFLYRNWQQVKKTNKAGYVDPYGNVDNTRDTNGNNLTDAKASDSTPENKSDVSASDLNNVFHPLSYNGGTAYVDSLNFPENE